MNNPINALSESIPHEFGWNPWFLLASAWSSVLRPPLNMRLLILILASVFFSSCDKKERSSQQVFLSEEGQQNLARFSHGEEPYLSLIRTTQLLDHLGGKGWSLRHISMHKYSLYLISDEKRELIHSSRIEKNDYPYIFMMIDDGVRVFELSNSSISSVKLKTTFASGRYRVEPIPNKIGTYEIFSTYNRKQKLVITLIDGENDD